MIREVSTQHPFGKGRAFRDGTMQALVSDEQDGFGRTYQHVSVAGKGYLPSSEQAMEFVRRLREEGHVNDDRRVERTSVVNPYVRHFLPVWLVAPE